MRCQAVATTESPRSHASGDGARAQQAIHSTLWLVISRGNFEKRKVRTAKFMSFGSVSALTARAGTVRALLMYFQVKLGVVRRDVDVSLQGLADNLAARENLLRTQLDGIQNLVVEPQPGTTTSGRPHVITHMPVRPPSIAEDEEDEEEEDDDGDQDDDDDEDDSAADY